MIELLRQSQNPDGFGTEEYWQKQNQEWLIRNMPPMEFHPEPKSTPWFRIARTVGLMITAIVAIGASIKQRRAAKKVQPSVPAAGNQAFAARR